MVEKHSTPAESRLDEIEMRLDRIESVLMRLTGPVAEIGIGRFPAGSVTITIHGKPLADFSNIIQEMTQVLWKKAEREERETTVEPWKHLVARRHPWRKQLYIKGRNMTVRQLVGGIKANEFSEEKAAANYHLPVEAIREALVYAETNAEVLDLDAAYERYLQARGGKRRAPQSAPR